MTGIDLRLLADEELPSILPLLQQTYPHLSEDCLRTRLAAMPAQGYRCVGAFAADGTLVGISGLWLRTHLWCGLMVEPDNVVVDAAWRSTGVGHALVQWVLAWGRTQGAEVSDLNCYVTNSAAHAFWMREGYGIVDFHFQQPLTSP